MPSCPVLPPTNMMLAYSMPGLFSSMLASLRPSDPMAAVMAAALRGPPLHAAAQGPVLPEVDDAEHSAAQDEPDTTNHEGDQGRGYIYVIDF